MDEELAAGFHDAKALAADLDLDLERPSSALLAIETERNTHGCRGTEPRTATQEGRVAIEDRGLIIVPRERVGMGASSQIFRPTAKNHHASWPALGPHPGESAGYENSRSSKFGAFCMAYKSAVSNGLLTCRRPDAFK
jgi:hypothetical protein